MRHKIILIICFLTFFLQGNGIATIPYQPKVEEYKDYYEEDINDIRMSYILDFEQQGQQAKKKIDEIKKEQEEIKMLIMLNKLKQINIAAE